MRIAILAGALVLLAVIVAVVLLTGSAGDQGSADKSSVAKTAKVSAPLDLAQLRVQAGKHSLPSLFIWNSPDQGTQARISLAATPKQLRVGYMDPSFKTISEKSRQKSTVFIVSEIPASDLNISQLKKTASDVVAIKGAKVYVPPKSLLKQGQLFALSDDHKLAGLISSIFTTRKQLQELAQQIVMIRS